jgi:hypothetical protein
MEEVKVAETVVNSVNGNLKVVVISALAGIGLAVGTTYAVKGIKKAVANHKEKKNKPEVVTEPAEETK